MTTNPVFFPGNVEPRYSEFLTFVGISVDEECSQHYLDSQIAYRRACLNAIAYLEKFGYSPERVYLLLGAAPVEGRFSGVVDIPNSCATLYLRPRSSTATSGPRRTGRNAPTAEAAP